jgi:hypothetical protein
VDATRVNNGAGGAAAAMSYNGDGKELLAARAAAWRARGRPAGGAKAVGELRGDAWSSAGAGERALGGMARGPAAALSHSKEGGRGGRRGR